MIVLSDEICGCVLGISPVSGYGCHNHSVLQGDRADVNRLKELGSGHCKADVCVRGLLMPFPLHTVLFYGGVRRGGCP
jgi:hypothetical protein